MYKIGNMFRTIIISISLLFILPFASFSQDEFPEATVENAIGETIDIKQYVTDGKPKIVSLWATWCGPCRAELNALKSVSERWKNEYGVEIITVSVDYPQMVARAKSMAKKSGWDYTFMHDNKQELMRALGVTGIPYSMLIDGDGKIRSVQRGYYPQYEKALEKKIKAL